MTTNVKFMSCGSYCNCFQLVDSFDIDIPQIFLKKVGYMVLYDTERAEKDDDRCITSALVQCSKMLIKGM